MFLGLGLATVAAKEFKLELYQHECYRGTNVWSVFQSRIDKLPPWKFGDGEPPLSLGKAVTIAKAWIVSKGCSQDSCVEEATVRPIYPEAGKYQKICYYNISFCNVGLVGHHRRCLVLMDGTVVEPDWPGVRPKNVSDYDSDDE
jgi:hypothetical protein